MPLAWPNAEDIYVIKAPENGTIRRPIDETDRRNTKVAVWAPQAPADGPEPLKYSKSEHGAFNHFGRIPVPMLK